MPVLIELHYKCGSAFSFTGIIYKASPILHSFNSKMPSIYCLSGLGADQRIFQKLDILGYELVPVHWCAYDKDDDLPDYARKMAMQIPEDNAIIIGVSFGGMLAAEIGKLRPVKKVILISSAKDARELPPVNRFARFMVNNSLIPVSIAKKPSKQIFERFGVETVEEKELLMSILQDTDSGFAKWAIKAIVNWRSTTHSTDILHIHGTDDHMIVPQYIKPDCWIQGGTHFMVYQRADEISDIISAYLARI